jgi:hypothetical protein
MELEQLCGESHDENLGNQDLDGGSPKLSGFFSGCKHQGTFRVRGDFKLPMLSGRVFRLRQ